MVLFQTVESWQQCVGIPTQLWPVDDAAGRGGGQRGSDSDRPTQPALPLHTRGSVPLDRRHPQHGRPSQPQLPVSQAVLLSCSQRGEYSSKQI